MITAKYQALFKCDRCGEKFTKEWEIFTIYGNPEEQQERYRIPKIVNPANWVSFFDLNFCPDCALTAINKFNQGKKEALHESR